LPRTCARLCQTSKPLRRDTVSRILVPSSSADAWRQLLAKPDLHWATGYSARTLAYAWEGAEGGLPDEIADILGQAFGPIELLLAIPEHKTSLGGGGRESQSDVFALARHKTGLVTCTVEGKVDEPFGPTVAQQMVNASPGKVERLGYLCHLLGIEGCPPDVHYQLLHRTASALIEAERFRTRDAAMIVHSFSPERRWFEAFARFCALFGREAEAGVPVTVSAPDGKRLVLGWACGEQRFRLM
jgi:hypothetical protein